jgi:hypothetical protein
MLGVSWLVAVGLLSYSLYLWHFPIISFLQIWTGVESLGPGAAGLAISCTGLLAFLTFRFIENPMRFSKLDGRKTVAVILIFVVGVVSLGFASQQPGEAASPEIRTAEALRDHKWVYFGVVDEREFQNERLLLGGLESVDVVVIGSSRLMQVSSAMLGSEALNLSVSGASLEDMFALAPSALVATGARRILLGADPWMIHLDSGQDRWRSLEDEASDWILLAESETRLTDAPRPIPEERNDSSAVLRSLYERINLGADDLVASHGRPELLPKKASDGSHIYDSAYVQQTEREKAAGFDGIIGYANMDSFAMSEKKVEQFKTLITYLRGNGVSVTLVLSPYHPELFRTLKTQHPGFLSAERAYRDIATETGTEILGSYDPVKVGCAMQDFYDGMHPDGSCMAKTIASAEVSNR